MRDDPFLDDTIDPPEPSALDSRLRMLGDDTRAAVPDDLLDRCLATVPGSRRGRAPRRWGSRILATAAAVLVAGSLALLARPRDADAAHTLQAVRNAWTEVPASHVVLERQGPKGTRAEETWFVRGKGRRTQAKVDGRLTLVVVNNGRWEFRWDVPGRLVAVWSAALLPAVGGRVRPAEQGLILEGDAFLNWAKEQGSELRVEPEADGGKVRKLTLTSPGLPGGLSPPRTETIWFDHETLRPLKTRSEYANGWVEEMTIDYPDPKAVAEDLFVFRPPADAVLEINDPDLGRQVYSEGQPKAAQTGPGGTKGEQR
jgi:hypothetical protein